MNGVLFKFKLFGIEVNVTLGYILFCWLISSLWGYSSATQNLAVISVVTISLLGHELGHAMVLRRMRIPCHINMLFMGGNTTWLQGPTFHRSWAVLLNSSGIAVNIVLAMIAFVIDRSGFQTSNLFLITFIRALFHLNIFWAILNVLPVLPLDGGNLLHSILGFFMREQSSLLISIGVSATVATVITILSLSTGIGLIIPIYFGFLAFDNIRKFNMLLSMRG